MADIEIAFLLKLLARDEGSERAHLGIQFPQFGGRKMKRQPADLRLRQLRQPRHNFIRQLRS